MTVTYVDRTEPSVVIVLPSNGDKVFAGSMVIKAEATDNIGITKVEFLDGATLIGVDSLANADTFDVSWTATEGPHMLSVKAWDAAFNSAVDLITISVVGRNHHFGQIDTNETWYPSDSPHVLDSDVWTGNNVTLTIMPGCVVQCSADVELSTGSYSGSIIAVGKPDSVITFTSAAGAVGGRWNGITFHASTLATACLSCVTIEYAGNDAKGAVNVDGCGLNMNHCTLRDNSGYGVYASAGGHFGQFSDNTITASGLYPVSIQANEVRTLGTGNQLTGNQNDCVSITNGLVSTTGTWLNHGVPYLVGSDGDVFISDAANGPVVTIAPGTTIRLTPGTFFNVGYPARGGLVADGTSGQITFTSSRIPSSPGDWKALCFHADAIGSRCQLKNCKIAYGGGNNQGNIVVSMCIPTITGCDIGYSHAYGIYLIGPPYPDPAQLLADNTFHDNASGSIGYYYQQRVVHRYVPPRK